MGGQGIAQILVYAIVLIALGYPLGLYMARVYGPEFRPRWLSAVEGGFYRVVRTGADDGGTRRCNGLRAGGGPDDRRD